LSPGYGSRIAARVRSRTLDDRLLAGARPEESGQLAARSARLLESGYRAEVAGALREMLDAAEHAQRLFLKAQVRLREWEIIQSRAVIRELADELEGDQPVNPRGVILADRLVRDGGSPMFLGSNKSIASALTETRDALRID
jgi:hypothetical protein